MSEREQRRAPRMAVSIPTVVEKTGSRTVSRVSFTFPLQGYGQIETLGWVLWRRRADAEIPAQNGGDKPILVKAGFGLLFEAISLDARNYIAKLVAESAGK